MIVVKLPGEVDRKIEAPLTVDKLRRIKTRYYADHPTHQDAFTVIVDSEDEASLYDIPEYIPVGFYKHSVVGMEHELGKIENFTVVLRERT